MSLPKCHRIVLAAAFILGFSSCEFQEKNDTSVAETEQLKVSAEGSLVVDSSEALVQLAFGNSATSLGGSVRSVETVTDMLGNVITAENILQIDSRYVFLKDLRQRGQSHLNKHKILDLKTGKLKRLEKWPDNTNRVVSMSGHAFYVSEGDLCAVNLEKGDCLSIAGQVPVWKEFPRDVYQNNGRTTFSERTWIHVDADLNVYALEYFSLSNSIYNQGYGAKFIRSGEAWVEDPAFNSTFFPNMPYGVSNTLPGALLMGRMWTVVDEYDGRMYEVEMAGAQMTVRTYDIDTWTAGTVVLTFALSHSITDSTFVGVNNSIQNGMITDGQSIIRILSSGGTLSAEEIAVPASVVRDNSIRYQGYTNYWPAAGITNWNYFRGDLYYLDPADNLIYFWDLDPTHAPMLMGPITHMHFLMMPGS